MSLAGARQFARQEGLSAWDIFHGNVRIEYHDPDDWEVSEVKAKQDLWMCLLLHAPTHYPQVKPIKNPHAPAVRQERGDWGRLPHLRLRGRQSTLVTYTHFGHSYPMIAKAFDDAWAELQGSHAEPAMSSLVRTALAKRIIETAQRDGMTAEKLRDDAIAHIKNNALARSVETNASAGTPS